MNKQTAKKKKKSKCHSDICCKSRVNVIYCAKCISKTDAFHNLFVQQHQNKSYSFSLLGSITIHRLP